MGEPVTQGQFFEVMQQIQSQIDAKHVSLRQYVGERSDKIENAMTDHAKTDLAVADRVSRLEEREKARDAEVVRRSTWVSLLVALPSAVMALYALLHK